MRRKCVAWVGGFAHRFLTPLLAALLLLNGGLAWGQGYVFLLGFPLVPLDSPRGVVTDPAGNLYIADSGNKRIIRVNVAQRSLKFFGEPYTGGVLQPGQINGIIDGIALDSAGRFYMLDTDTLHTWNPATDAKAILLGNAVLKTAQGVVVGANGTIYISELNGTAPRVRRFDATGTELPNSAINLVNGDRPGDLAIDGNGILYIADERPTGSRVIVYDTVNNVRLSDIGPNVTIGGAATTLARIGSLALDATGLYIASADTGNKGYVFRVAGGTTTKTDVTAFVTQPEGIAPTRNGGLWLSGIRTYVGGQAHNVIAVDPALRELARLGSRGDKSGEFNGPTDIALDPAGNLYVTESSGGRVQKFSPTGAILGAIPAGTNVQPGSIAIGGDGAIYLTNGAGFPSDIVKFTYDPAMQTYIRSVIKNEKIPGGRDMQAQRGIAVDSLNRLWISDTFENRIVLYDPSATDDPATPNVNEQFKVIGAVGTLRGQFRRNTAIAVYENPAQGTFYVYILDETNNRCQRFDPNATDNPATPDDERFAAFPLTGVSGNRRGLTADKDGSIFVTNLDLGRVEVYDPNGVLLTTFGSKNPGYQQFRNPEGIEVNPVTGDVYVADTANHRVQVYAPFFAAPTLAAISPSQRNEGPVAGATLRITGSGFAPRNLINFDGKAMQTTYVSPTEIIGQFTVGVAPFPDIAALNVGVYPVTVSSSGGVSNTLTLTVVKPPYIAPKLGVVKLPAPRVVRNGSNLEITFTLTNSGGDAKGVQIVKAILNKTGLISGLPLAIGDLGAGQSKSVTLAFPGTAAAPGAKTLLTFTVSHAGQDPKDPPVDTILSVAGKKAP